MGWEIDLDFDVGVKHPGPNINGVSTSFRHEYSLLSGEITHTTTLSMGRVELVGVELANDSLQNSFDVDAYSVDSKIGGFKNDFMVRPGVIGGWSLNTDGVAGARLGLGTLRYNAYLEATIDINYVVDGEVMPHRPTGTVSSAVFPGGSALTRAGYETNALDVRSDLNPGNRNGVIAPTPDPDRWKEAWRDQDLNRGYSQDPSRPGNLHPDLVSNPSPMGSAINQTRPGFSVPSAGGYASRGINDVEGPEGHGINRGGSYNDVKTPPKNTSTGGNSGNFGGGNGGSENSGTHKGSAPSTSFSTGNGPGYSANTGPVNSGTGPQNISSKSPTKTPEKNLSGSSNADHYDRVSHGTVRGGLPIIFDLDGDGIQITELSRSTKFIDGGDGLLHKTAWAAAGNGVLFFDPDGRNAITEKRQYVFTDWNPTASGDIEAIRSVWDSNGDGKLTAADTDFAKFKVMVTNANGTTTVQTLTQLGITEINLTADTTQITLPDGSQITGQTTFTRGNGTTGTVANTTLISEAEGHRVVQTTSTDGNGNAVVVSTGYGAGGAVAFVITSVTSPTGALVTNSYDTNGDGVTDRIQTVTTVVNGNGSRTETLINKAGALAATAVLLDRTVTTTSADNKVVTIDRDTTGGGWTDEREVRTTLAGGNRTVVISELAQNGAVIRSSSETLSANGQTRAQGVDADGNATTDLTTTHVITVAGNNSRTELTTLTNGNASVRSSQTETVTTDGKTRVVSDDLDGDGDVDRAETSSITVNAGGATSSAVTVRNGDGSIRSTATQSQSADTLVKTRVEDVNGDGINDLTSAETTMINGDGSRQTTLLLTNTDGSVRGLQNVTLGVDKVTSESWVDQNQDGVFQAGDLVRSVTANTGTLARTAVVYDRNPDGSVRASATSVTSADGLTINTTADADGDGDIDLNTSDVTLVNSGIATRTVLATNQDASLNSKSVTVTSADGLTVTRDVDIDGNGSYDSRTVNIRVLNVDGSITSTVTQFAGNGTTLTGKVISQESADRRVSTVTTDANGDWATDSTSSSIESADGSRTVTNASYAPNGSIIQKTVSMISANGLISTMLSDKNGDLINETVVSDTTTLNADGSRTRTVDVNNGDSSNRSLSITTVGDDGLSVATQTDNDGDNVFERTSTNLSVLNADGSVARTDQVRAQNSTLLNQTQTTVSDDRLITLTQLDPDGDGDFDLVTKQTVTLLTDGGQTVSNELRNDLGVLRYRATTSTSDDKRLVTTTLDVNGDGQSDSLSTRLISNDGWLTATESQLSATGAVQSRTLSVTNDDGLSSVVKWDQNGDGSYERQTSTISVLNADGSTTAMITSAGANGAIYSRSTVITSDDRLVATRADDIDGDGTTELTTTSTTLIANNGVQSETIQTVAENTAQIARKTTVTSADHRNITQSVDLDGNGTNDRVTITTVASTGIVTQVTTYLSTSGVVEGSVVKSISSDGLLRTQAHDTNGDGRSDLSSNDRTTLSSNGSVARSVTYTNERNQIIGQQETYSSDDGNTVSVSLDLNGDRVFEFKTDTIQTYALNGDVVVRQATKDATDDTISEVTTTTSGNGLRTTVVTDFSGDGNADRTVTLIRLGDGSWTENNTLYHPGNKLLQSQQKAMTADGRTLTTTWDVNGDGSTDRRTVAVTDLLNNLQIDYTDIKLDGKRSALITEKTSANGMKTSYTFDVDNDSKSDFSRATDIRFNTDGGRVETFRETYEANAAIFGTYGSKKIVYSEVTTRSANGLQSVTQIDADGNGIVDATTTELTTINVDGSRTNLIETRYVEGSLRAKFETKVSSDERLKVAVSDYDGNGIADKIAETRQLADGSTAVTENSFGKGGARIQTFVTTTSADGLTTRLTRGATEQTITRSAVDLDSYTWNNGVTASTTSASVVVSHLIDALGIETWTMTSKWFVATTLQTQVSTVRLDAVAKAWVLAEAARIFDTVLDRDLDVTEIEMLVPKIANGQLDEVALATELLASSEFATRYGTLSNAEFITQIYLNALGRVPSLVELSDNLTALASNGITRAKLAAGISEGIEHIVVGTGHMSTNNFDVIMNPAVFERSLDAVYARIIVENLVDVVYDRAATAQELRQLSDLLLRDVSNADDIAALLLAVRGEVQGTATSSLFGLNGAALVEQAFVNAMGRQPSAQEQSIWESHLSSGRITVAQFVASLAQSMDHLSVGPGSVSTVVPIVTVLIGTNLANNLTGTAGQDLISGLDGNDVIIAGEGADRLIGGLGADVLWGGASTTVVTATNGNDTYVWAKGDGSDTINDWSQSMIESDTLELTNVKSNEVALSFSNAAGADLLVTIVPTGEVIRIDERYQNVGFSYGIERIVFSDGITWSLADIQSQARFTGDALPNTLIGTNYRDNLFGLAGNDTLVGSNGDDRLIGGLGVDILWGAANSTLTPTDGNDTYAWSKGDGNDEVRDWSQSLTEIDTLELTNVTSSDVALSFSNAAGADLLVTIVSTGEVIRIDERYQATGYGYGIERIVFSDNVSWSLEDILARAQLSGDAMANTLNGTAFRDNLFGLAGNDALNGNEGDDVLTGGLNLDTLSGGNGSDRYDWAKGDGNDTINDAGASLVEVDRLQLINVASNDAVLSRANGSNNLTIRIVSTGEVITVLNRFASNTSGVGIEGLSFNDGVVWDLQDILARTHVDGTSGAETMTGIAYRDNLYGLAGNDALNGNDGDDLLVGGVGLDSLAGGNGSDVYEWQTGDGNDTINDTGTSLAEVDTLLLTNVASSGAVISRSGTNLVITVPQTGEVITVLNRFATASGGAGIEAIAFSDGVVSRIMEGPTAFLQTNGTSADEALTGWAYADILSGLGGNDTLTSNDGNDTLVGGAGNDSLLGGNGGDTYDWSKTHGNDTINDTGASLTEVDRLRLTDVASTDVQLTRANGSSNLVIRVVSTGEMITVVGRIGATLSGIGIETISFNDGVVWTLNDILASSWLTGTSAPETLTGTAYRDNLAGMAGDDVLNAGDGDDLLAGGLGMDALNGSNGSDSYEWSKGDGNDTIADAGASLTEVDTLVLKNVASTDAFRLNRTAYASGPSNDILLLVESTNETIRISNEYSSVTSGAGIERIVFADGIIWQLDDIFARVRASGGSNGDSLIGTAFRDNLYGFNGNDTLNAGTGDDFLNGGEGNDQLDGGNGNDLYEWRGPDGNDVLSDTGMSIYEVDLLYLAKAVTGDVVLRGTSGSNDLSVIVTRTAGVTSTITITNQFLNSATGVGIEGIKFADGTVWSREDIISKVGTYGTSGADIVTGTASNDRIFADAGNDTLNGGAGDDTLTGEGNADLINGGTGIDIASYYSSIQGVQVDLRVTSAQIGVVGGHEIGDVLQAIEGLEGSALNDTLSGDDQSNWLIGREGADVIYGFDGFDQIRGGSGSDTIYGGDGADDIRGEHNSDSLFGGAGDDTIDGGSFDDQIFGGTGNDYIISGTGNDTLWGEQGADTFHFADLLFENDIVMDYQDGIDRLWFAPAAAVDINDFLISGNGTTSVTLAIGTNTLTLNGLAPIILTADDFLFA